MATPMIIGRRQVYWLTEPEDAELLYSYTKISPVQHPECYLCNPKMCIAENDYDYLVLTLLGVGIPQLLQIIKPKLTNQKWVEILLRLSKTMQNVHNITKEEENLNNILIKVFNQSGFAHQHYGQWVSEYADMDFDIVLPILLKFLKIDNIVELFKEDCFNVYFKEFNVDTKLYLSEDGLIYSNQTKKFNGVRTSTRTYTGLSNNEKNKCVVIPENKTVYLASDAYYTTLSNDSKLKQIMAEYLADPKNASTILNTDPYTDEIVELCLKEYYNYYYSSALENKLLICNEHTILRDYGLRDIAVKDLANQVEIKRSLQDLNRGLYCMSQILDMPEYSIGKGKLAIEIGKPDANDKASGYFMPKNTKIHLNMYIGAGSLAHEWFHYLDFQTAINLFGLNDVIKLGPYSHISEQYKKLNTTMSLTGDPDVDRIVSNFRDFYDRIIKDNNGVERSFYKNCNKTKNKSYYKMPTEVVARAFNNVLLIKFMQNNITNTICFNNADLAEPRSPGQNEALQLEPIFDTWIADAKLLDVI